MRKYLTYTMPSGKSRMKHDDSWYWLWQRTKELFYNDATITTLCNVRFKSFKMMSANQSNDKSMPWVWLFALSLNLETYLSWEYSRVRHYSIQFMGFFFYNCFVVLFLRKWLQIKSLFTWRIARKLNVCRPISSFLLRKELVPHSQKHRSSSVARRRHPHWSEKLSLDIVYNMYYCSAITSYHTHCCNKTLYVSYLYHISYILSFIRIQKKNYDPML